MHIHLIDGTYELFRHFYAVPSARDEDGREIGAVRGVVGSVLGMINRGATHVGVATDHVIESFRNRLWPGYKTGAGIDPDLLSQFGLLEEALQALGVTVWPMVEYEADDALAAAAVKAAADPRVEQVLICTPDKDLAQCVRGSRVVQLNRRTNVVMDEAGVMGKFGVAPASIPDYLALVGDAADGYPGIDRVGREVVCGGARTLRPSRGDSGGLAHLGRQCREPRARSRPRSPAIASARSCSAISRRSVPMSPCSRTSTSCAGRGPTPAFPPLAARMDRAMTAAPRERNR